jgi:hypothetical protein
VLVESPNEMTQKPGPYVVKRPPGSMLERGEMLGLHKNIFYLKVDKSSHNIDCQSTS